MAPYLLCDHNIKGNGGYLLRQSSESTLLHWMFPASNLTPATLIKDFDM